MSWRIRDLADSKHALKVNAWNWRPTLAILETLKILDVHRLEMMGFNGYVEVTVDEAREIANKLQNNILVNMEADTRVNYDLTLTDEPNTFVYHDDPDKNYSATFTWLQKFADFCRTCNGFVVT